MAEVQRPAAVVRPLTRCRLVTMMVPEINLYMEYEGKHCLDDVLQLYRSCNIKVLNIQITRSAENGEHNACAIFTLRLPRSCGVEKLLTLVGRREGIVSVEEL